VEILGVGPLEIVVILVIALLVFGPEKLPEIGANLGKAVREMRNLSREITQGVDSARQAIEGPVEELSKPFKEANQAVKDVAAVAGTMRNPGQALEKALVGQLASNKAAETENTIASPNLGNLEPPPIAAPVTSELTSPEPGTSEPAAAEPAADSTQTAVEEIPTTSPVPEPAEMPAPEADVKPRAETDVPPASPEPSISSWEI